jgi:hypothetical protein
MFMQWPWQLAKGNGFVLESGCFGGFRNETGSRSGLKYPQEILKSSIYNSFPGGDDGRGYRNMYKIDGVSESVLCR